MVLKLLCLGFILDTFLHPCQNSLSSSYQCGLKVSGYVGMNKMIWFSISILSLENGLHFFI